MASKDDDLKRIVNSSAPGQETTKAIDALTAETLVDDCRKFSNMYQLLDYLILLKKPGFYKEVMKEKNEEDNKDDNFILINQDGIQLNDTNYSKTLTKIIFVYQQRMFNSNSEQLISDNLNHFLDPLPNLIKPVKPLDNTRVSLKGWLLALEVDVDTYYKQVILKFNSNHRMFDEVLVNLLKYLDNFYEKNIKYDPNQIDINEMYSYDYNSVLAKLKGIRIDDNHSLITLVDLNKFDSYYLNFKDLKYKIHKFVNDIVNESYKKLKISYKKMQLTCHSLRQGIHKLLASSLEFDIDTLMFDKFKMILEGVTNNNETVQNNNLAGQIDTLYTIANSLFAKSNEILLIKRNIQASIIKFISGEITTQQIKIINFKNLLNRDLNENLSLLTVKYETLLFLHYDLPLLYGLNLVEIYRRKVLFKLKFLLKFDNLVIQKNPWIEDDIENEINIRNQYLDSFTQIYKIKFINIKHFNQRLFIKNTFADLNYLKKHINLGEEEEGYEERNNLDKKMDQETKDIVNYCQNLDDSGFTSLSDELLRKFEDMKKEILNQSQSLITEAKQVSQENKLISSLQTKVDSLKSKLVLQDLFNVDEWPIVFTNKENDSVLTEDSKENNNDPHTMNFLIEEMKKQKIENQNLKDNLAERNIMFKQDFSDSSNINAKLLSENASLKKANEDLKYSNVGLTQRIKADLYKEISLLEKIGLLLDADQMKINRVKGLKKSNSNMTESTILLSSNANITESISVKANISALKEMQQEKDLIKFDEDFKQIYINGIEKRFVDLEELAKRLNKENKQLKKHIKKYDEDASANI